MSESELPQHEWLQLGDAHRRIRVILMRTPREIGALRGLTARQVSDMEHGRADPTPLLTPLWTAMLRDELLDIPPFPGLLDADAIMAASPATRRWSEQQRTSFRGFWTSMVATPLDNLEQAQRDLVQRVLPCPPPPAPSQPLKKGT